MLLHSITLNNFLSFGELVEPISLNALNIVIGPNGSGKSNLLESIELLRSAPEQLLKPIREGGGVSDWLWKGVKGTPTASLEVVVIHPYLHKKIRYVLSFTAVNQRFEIVDEIIEDEHPKDERVPVPYYYHFNDGRPTLNVKGEKRFLQQEDVDMEKSILSQRRDPDQYPEITFLAKQFGSMKLYREWSFGRYTISRLPQKADLPNDMLEPDGSNLGLVLHRLRRDPAVKQRLLEALRALYDGIDDYDVHI